MTSAPERRPRRATPEAAPFILREAGDLARPRASVSPLPAEDLEHLPGTSSWLAGLMNVVGWTTRGNWYLRDQVQHYGAVYRHRFGPELAVYVTDPVEIAAILRNDSGAWSSALAWRVFFEGTTKSPTLDFPVALDFGKHQEARRVLQSAFGGTALESYVRIAAQMFEPAIGEWLRRGRSSFKREVRRLFALVAGRIFMGVEDPAEAEILDGATSDFWGAPAAIVRNALISRKWRRAVRGMRTLEDTFRAKVVARRNSDGDDLFSRLCREAHGLDWLDDDGLVRLFIGVMAAAFDTTSLGVTSMAYLLARHPEWQERLREEGRGIDPSSIVRQDAKKLVAYEWAWKETLRLLPVTSSVPRRPLRDVEVAGHRIPAGAFVVPMYSPSQLDPKYWSNPEAFDPERFSPARAEDKRLRGGFMPFGAGAHACIGAQLSTLEATVFWHAFLARARIRLAKPERAGHQFMPLGVVRGDVELIVEPA